MTATTSSKALFACCALVASLASNVTVTTAQTATPSARMQSDERNSECSRYSRAYARLEKAKSELNGVAKAFLPTDDVKPKVVEIATQLNDAEMTVRSRVSSCPPEFRV